jgi:hypothetical protein
MTRARRTPRTNRIQLVPNGRTRVPSASQKIQKARNGKDLIELLSELRPHNSPQPGGLALNHAFVPKRDHAQVALPARRRAAGNDTKAGIASATDAASPQPDNVYDTSYALVGQPLDDPSEDEAYAIDSTSQLRP